MNTKRQSGKTYRALLRAIADASEGYYVIFIVPSINHRIITVQMARSIISPIITVIKTNSTNNIIHIADGFLDITTRELFRNNLDRYAGIQNIKTVFDE